MVIGIDKYKDGFKLITHEDLLHTPFEWKKPKVVFVNSISDLLQGQWGAGNSRSMCKK